MYIYLKNYNGINCIYSYSKDLDNVDILLNQGKNVLFHDSDKCYLYPDNKFFTVDSEENDKLNILCEEDVLQFSDNGIGFVFYSSEADDNTIVPTCVCNSNCIMCPIPENVRRNSDISSLDFLLLQVKHIPKSAKHITLTGGEPFIIGKDIFTLLKHIRDELPYTSLQILTNGRIFANKAYFSELIDNIPSNVEIGIPIHGADKSVHDYITSAAGSFDQTVIGIKRLISRGVQVELRIVVSKLNAAYIKDIASLIVKEFPKVNSVKLMGLEMLGNAAVNMERVWIPYQDAFEASEQAINILLSEGIDVAIYNFPLCVVPKKYWVIYKRSIGESKTKYLEKCEKCKEKSVCGGFFSGTIRLIDKVTPFYD